MKQMNSTDLNETQEQNSVKRFVEPPPKLQKPGPKIGLDERMYDFFQRLNEAGGNLAGTLQQLPPESQERYTERFCITIAVGVACVLSSFFYWFLPPLVRVLVVPVFIGAAWWFGAKVLIKLVKAFDPRQEMGERPQLSNFVEFFHLLEAIKFCAITFAIAAIPFLVMPAHYESALESADVRTLFLCLFMWNLIGAPLFAQTRDAKSRLIISLVFAVPVALAPFLWIYVSPVSLLFLKS